MANKIILIGNMGPDEYLRVMLKTLHALGCHIEHPTIESVTQILRDEYDIEISVKKQPQTIQELAYDRIEESIKFIAEMRKYIPDISHQKTFSRAQQKHYNHMQNVRMKKYANFHKNKQR